MKFKEKQRLKASIGNPDMDAQDHTTRKPTERELEQVIKNHIEKDGLTFKEAKRRAETFFYSVIEDYQTGCPGYAGKVLIEIGTAGPGYHRVYTWSNSKIRRMEQTPEMRS
jgi:hypothetical protein